MDPNVKPAPKMRGFGRRIAAFLIALGVGFALFLAPAVAPKTSPVLAPTAAHAAVGDSNVVVKAGGSVKVYCDWNQNWYYILQNGDDSRRVCTKDNHDTDGLASPNSRRCIWVFGIGSLLKGRQGVYYIKKNTKYKIADLSTVWVGKYIKSECPRKYTNPS